MRVSRRLRGEVLAHLAPQFGEFVRPVTLAFQHPLVQARHVPAARPLAQRRDRRVMVEQGQAFGRMPVRREQRRFLHRGLAERSFERRFQLADHVIVDGANLADGLLSIALRRELPEQLKPRTIAIDTTPTKPAIEGKATNAA